MIVPGATIGVLGGGQLGRMFAMAARNMGYRVRALDPSPHAPARPVVDKLIVGALDDVAAASRLVSRCDVVTVEIENIATDALAAVERVAPLRPSPSVLATVRDRATQREWLQANGFPQGPFETCTTGLDRAAVLAMGPGCIAKVAVGGYDGRGQLPPDLLATDHPAWTTGRFVVEQRLTLDREISVLVARSPSGAVSVFPPALNHHERGVLAWSVLPAPIEPALAVRAQELARAIAEALDVVGLLCVELFVVGGELLVNELAPRPHNSYHGSERGLVTSQFEQHVRAICDLPLGSTDVIVPTAIANLLGERWEPSAPDFGAALLDPNVRVHLYGKATARTGRKMGHLSAVGATGDEALKRVLDAAGRLDAWLKR